MLKCWLRHRQLKLPQRLYLWRTCINTILTYGILATNLTVQTLQEYQTTVYQMLRIIIGDHAYMTRHTHQQALQHHNLPALAAHGRETMESTPEAPPLTCTPGNSCARHGL